MLHCRNFLVGFANLAYLSARRRVFARRAPAA